MLQMLKLLVIATALGGVPIAASAAKADAPVEATEKKATKKKVVKRRRRKKKTNKRQRWPTNRPKVALRPMPPMGPAPFPEGERLAYSIKMFNAMAGEAIVGVGKKTTFNGKAVLPLVGFIRSSPFLSAFYPVDDKLVVLVDQETFLPMKTDFLVKENGKVVDYHTRINQKGRLLKSTRLKRGKTLKRNFSPAGDVMEALSSLYAVRRMELKPGLGFDYYLWDGRKERLVKVDVEKIEKVWTPDGFKEAYKINVSTTVTGGFVKAKVFKYKPRRGTIWIGTDAARTPYKMVTPTKIGQAQATLVRRYIEK